MITTIPPDIITVYFSSPPAAKECGCDNDFQCLIKECEKIECLIIKKMRAIITGRATMWNHESKVEKHGMISYETICELFFDSLNHGFTCQSCGCVMVMGGSFPNSCSIDHIISRFNGGTNVKENLQIICRNCNLEKEKVENHKGVR